MNAKKKEEPVTTVTTTDRNGDDFETPVGIDGVNPVTPNNPPAKAVPADDVDVLKEALQAEQDRYDEAVGTGSDGPGNEHNEDGIASDADKRQGSARPTTSAESPAPQGIGDTGDKK